MADTAVVVNKLGLDAATNAATAVALTPAENHVIEAGGYTGKLFVTVSHTAAAAKDITFKAGVGPRAALGDLTVNFGIGNVTPVVKHFVLESARFADAKGNIIMNAETGASGTVVAYRLPPGA